MSESLPSLLLRVLAALEEATGLGELARSWGGTPVRAGWTRTPGAALALLLLAQLATGLSLAIYYSPSSTTSWASVFHIEEQVLGGSLVRGLHAFGASAIVLALMVHVLSLGLTRRYRGGRRVGWVLGLLFVPVIATFALTGYLLPWDQKGYWATQVATGIMRGTPVVGGAVARTFQGGAELGSLTLTRFYAIHVVLLPLTLAALLSLHLRVWRRLRVSEPEEGAVAYWPNQAFRDLLVASGVLAVIALLALTRGAGLEAPADPTSDYPPRPEWYFAPLRELLKTIPEPWGSVFLPGALFATLAALPWIDGRTERPRLARALLLIPFLGWLGLLVHTTRLDRNDTGFKERRATATADAELARALARRGVPGDGGGELLWRYPPRMGQRLFAEHCQQCHEVDGKGGPEKADDDAGPVLSGYLGLDWMREVIEHPEDPKYFGRVPSLREEMPPLDPEHRPNLNAMAAFVRAQDPEAAARLDAKLVAAGRKAYFAADCNSCHQLKPGVGDLGPNLAGYGTEDWLLRFLRDPGHELFYAEANDMPAYGEDLSEEELRALVVYLRMLDGDPYPDGP